MGYEPDPADLVLSSVPGQEMFDPRKRKFSSEELKPQPMIKKARKVFIPEDCKVSWCQCFGWELVSMFWLGVGFNVSVESGF